jgi:hypothetical protein
MANRTKKHCGAKDATRAMMALFVLAFGTVAAAAQQTDTFPSSSTIVLTD